MKKWMIILASVLMIICLGVGGYLLYKTGTPEYALLETFMDIKESGIDGLEPHMTKEGWEQVKTIKEITEHPIVAALSSMFPKQTEEMLSKIKSMEWSVKDILKSKDHAEVIIQFSDSKNIKGTISLTMIKVDHEWKIDKINWPKFEMSIK